MLTATDDAAPTIAHSIHVSDIHFWQYAFNPLQLFSKRLLGMALAPGAAGAQVPARAGRARWSSGCVASSPTTS